VETAQSLPLPAELVGSRPAPGMLALVQALTNSVDLEGGVDRLSDLDGFTEWVTAVGLGSSALTPTPLPALSDRDRRATIELREGIRALVRDRDDVDSASSTSIQKAIDDLKLTVVYREGAFRSDSTTPLGRTLAPIVDALRDAMSDGTWLRLKVCARDKCQWLFWDNSRNQGSHWCTTDVCGSREKARRAYARSTGRASD
jgi:predicted RNA-binding Zn ribbon-like protein